MFLLENIKLYIMRAFKITFLHMHIVYHDHSHFPLSSTIIVNETNKENNKMSKVPCFCEIQQGETYHFFKSSSITQVPVYTHCLGII
jgi:hypothetical protein